MFSFLRKTHKGINKPCIFISGCPRSGTSLLTKIIDSHSDIGILMENIFENRKRHGTRAKFWRTDKELGEEIYKVYKMLPEKIVGNKVCNPDVWSNEDILRFCYYFQSFKIIWIVRDPTNNLISRYNREEEDHYSSLGKKYLQLDYSSRFATWASSWRLSIQNYEIFKGHIPDKILLVYYEDLIIETEKVVRTVCEFLEISYEKQMLEYYNQLHYDSNGVKKKDLKYKDGPLFKNVQKNIDKELEAQISKELAKHDFWFGKWKEREI